MYRRMLLQLLAGTGCIKMMSRWATDFHPLLRSGQIVAQGIKDPRQDCMNACKSLSTDCLFYEDQIMDLIKKHPENASRLIKLHQMVRDCGELCSINYRFLLRSSNFIKISCRTYGEACGRTADFLGEVKVDMKEKDGLIDSLRGCGESCAILANRRLFPSL